MHVFLAVGEAVLQGDVAPSGDEAGGIGGVDTPALGLAIRGLDIGVLRRQRRERVDVADRVVQGGAPGIGLEVDQLVGRLPAVTRGPCVGIDITERRLQRAFTAQDGRRHQLAVAALVLHAAHFQRLVGAGFPGCLEQPRLVVDRGVEHFFAGTEAVEAAEADVGVVGPPAEDVGDALVAEDRLRGVRAAFAGEVVAGLAACEHAHHFKVLPAFGGGDAATAAGRLAGGWAVHAGVIGKFGRQGFGAADLTATAVGDEATAIAQAAGGEGRWRRCGVVAETALQADAPILVAGDDVLGVQGAHADHAADRADAFGTAGRALLDVDAANHVRVDIAAPGHAGIAAVDGDLLLAAVDQHRHAVEALHAADVQIERTGVAVVAVDDAGHALEDVASLGAARTLDLLQRQVRAGLRGGVRRVGRIAAVIAQLGSVSLVTLHPQRADAFHAVGRRALYGQRAAGGGGQLQAAALQRLGGGLFDRVLAMHGLGLLALQQGGVHR